MLNIYDKNGKHKATLNYTINEFKPSWYPEWKEGDLISATKLNNPIIVDGQIREMTREELVAAGEEIQLNDGEKIVNKKIVVIEKPSGLIKAVWNKESYKWIEGYTRDEFFKDIDRIKAQVLEPGYAWEGHTQKCRDKDMSLMTTTIESMKDYKSIKNEDLTITWYFDDNDGVLMNLNKMIDLRLTGVSFIQSVYQVENKLKTSNIQKVTKEKYLELLKM